MEKYYQTIDQNIRHIIDSGKQVVIYPMGMMGIYAREILNKRYGREGIYVDNVQCDYSDEILSFREVCTLDRKNIGILVCVLKKELEIELVRQCEGAGIEAVGIRNPCVHSYKNKAVFFGEIIEACKVKSAVEFPLVRIGKNADGGYVMLDDFERIEACYSFGIGAEVSWEESMAAKNIDVYCYDHTIDCMPRDNVKIHFFRNGIAGSDSSDGIFKSMGTFLRQNKSQTDNLILKMDVEGAEWEFLQKVEKNVLSCFKQMTFELHDLTDESRGREVLFCLNKLRETHQPVWIHGNNAGLSEKSGIYIVPQMLEITYVRKDSYRLEECEYDCPIHLDYPNISDFNEIDLRGWGGLRL